MNAGVLYISYDGLLEPLGQSQVLAYLRLLVADRPIHLITYEKAEDWNNVSERKRLAQEVRAAGIHWYPLRYHKTPTALATGWDIAIGTGVGVRLVRQHQLKIVHARSYVAATIALAIRKQAKVKFLFDMRGFWADERVDGGLWPRSGPMYRIAKSFERRFLVAADHVVSLTHAAVREMKRFPYLKDCSLAITVIPTCADLSRFKPIEGVQDRASFVLGYVGSAGTWYLFDEVAACFLQLLRLRPNARLLVVNRGEHAFIRRRLEALHIPASAFEIVTATHADVPLQISRMHAGIFFIKPVFSKQASAPTKLGEFLGCGIPCLGNSGVGDMQEVLEKERVGVVASSFTDSAFRDALHELFRLVEDPETKARCAAAARKHFSLEEGVARYRKIYESLDQG